MVAREAGSDVVEFQLIEDDRDGEADAYAENAKPYAHRFSAGPGVYFTFERCRVSCGFGIAPPAFKYAKRDRR
jgi:hypothetical protein